MNNGLWISWPVLLVACLCAAAPTRSAAQTNLVVNVGISPPISTNLIGATIVLSATQDVQSIFFDYEWAQNGRRLVDGDQISGSSSPTLIITDAQVTNTGIYTVSISLAGVLQARAISTVYVVQLHVGIDPPVSTNLAGSAIILSATQDVQSVAFDYQWAKDGIALVDDDRIFGSLTPRLTITDSQITNSGIYTVSLSVTGALQATASSLVYVVAPPAIQGLETITSGATVTLTANATGGLLEYQWSWQGQLIP